MAGAAHPMQAHGVDSRVSHSRSRLADAREGIAAFLDKRETQWPDRVSGDMLAFHTWALPPFV